jgi:hypothetical protein
MARRWPHLFPSPLPVPTPCLSPPPITSSLDQLASSISQNYPPTQSPPVALFFILLDLQTPHPPPPSLSLSLLLFPLPALDAPVTLRALKNPPLPPAYCWLAGGSGLRFPAEPAQWNYFGTIWHNGEIPHCNIRTNSPDCCWTRGNPSAHSAGLTPEFPPTEALSTPKEAAAAYPLTGATPANP